MVCEQIATNTHTRARGEHADRTMYLLCPSNTMGQNDRNQRCEWEIHTQTKWSVPMQFLKPWLKPRKVPGRWLALWHSGRLYRSGLNCLASWPQYSVRVCVCRTAKISGTPAGTMTPLLSLIGRVGLRPISGTVGIKRNASMMHWRVNFSWPRCSAVRSESRVGMNCLISW